MRIYLAARYSLRENMKVYRDILEQHGHEVVSRWIDFADMPESFEWYDPDKHGPDDSAHAAPEYRAGIATVDIEDVMRADATILFTPGGSRGGCFVEWGAAIATMIFREELRAVAMATQNVPVRPEYRLLVVGPRINVFQNYPGVKVFNKEFEHASTDHNRMLNFMDALVALSVVPVS